MPDNRTILTRQELFDQIWTKPAIHLAKELGVSVTAVIRSCERAGVPRPTSGHWTQLEHGKAPARPALPPAPLGISESVDLVERTKRRGSPVAPKPHAALPTLEPGSHPLEKWHPMVKLTRTAYQSTGRDPKTDIVYPKGEIAHNWIAATKPHLDRGLRILNQLAWSLEENGFSFELPERGKSQIRLVYTETKTEVAFVIREELERYERELKPEEKNSSYIWNRWKHRSTGSLRLIVNEYHPEGARKSWGDGKHAKLEDKLVDAAAGFVICAQGKHAKELEWKERQRIWDEEAKKRRDEEDRLRREKERREVLLAAAMRWTHAKQLSDFRVACEARLQASTASGDLSPEQRDWLNWVDAVIQDTDPLRSGFLARLEKNEGDTAEARY